MVEIFNALAALFSLVGVGAPQNFVFEDSLKIDAIVEVANSSLVEIPSNYKELLCEKPIYNCLGADRYRLIKFQSNYGIYDIQEEMLIKILSYEQFECLNIDSVIFFFPNDKCSFIYFDELSNCFYDCMSGAKIDNLNPLGNSDSINRGEYYLRIPIAEDATKIDNYYYFEELGSAHGYNVDGTCAIVSSQILLNYYDSFYDDRLVDEQLDVNFKTFESNSSISEFYVDYNTDFAAYDYFHDYLCDFIVENTGESNPHDGVGVNYQIEMIKKYYESKGIEYTSTVSEGNWADLITARQVGVIKDAIDNNRPVIAGGNNAVGPHSVVAYAYNDEYVWVHTGWGYVAAVSWDMFTSHIFDFSKYGYAGAIDIYPSGEHFHSDNFYVESDEEYLCTCGSTFKKQKISPEDYGFEDAYPSTNTYKLVGLSNGFEFETNRLRAGYIQSQVVNLSPRREGAGTAYLEYNFPSSVARINVDLSYWSSQELVESPNFTCCFEYFDRTSAINPVKLIDLVNDVELSTDRYNQDNFAFHFSKNNLTKFRFYSTSDALGDRNKGRLSIGDMVIFYET